jgi:hypothetical protein
VSASGYFIAAGIVLLLGWTAMPNALAAYALASARPQEAVNLAIGIWASFAIVVAVAGPVMLTIAGLIKLAFGRERD